MHIKVLNITLFHLSDNEDQGIRLKSHYIFNSF